MDMTLRYSHLSPDHKTRVEVLGNRMDTIWSQEAKKEIKSVDIQDLDEAVSLLKIVG